MSDIAPDPRTRARARQGARALDRVLPYTRVVAYVIIPFLVVAACLLLVLPGGTEQHFAWTINPPVTAMLLGSAYAGGIWFFVQVASQRHWHRVRHGFPAVLVFASLLAAATFLHWDRFHFGHVSFITWVVLYVATPVLVLIAIVLELREDDGAPEADDVTIPRPWRYVLALVGAAASVTGLVLFAVPSLLIERLGVGGHSAHRTDRGRGAHSARHGEHLDAAGLALVGVPACVPGPAREPRLHRARDRGAVRRPRVGAARGLAVHDRHRSFSRGVPRLLHLPRAPARGRHRPVVTAAATRPVSRRGPRLPRGAARRPSRTPRPCGRRPRAMGHPRSPG